VGDQRPDYSDLDEDTGLIISRASLCQPRFRQKYQPRIDQVITSIISKKLAILGRVCHRMDVGLQGGTALKGGLKLLIGKIMNPF